MKIAKPSDGFRIRTSAEVRAFVTQTATDDPDFSWRWETVVARLKATGHVEGRVIDGMPAQRAATFTVGDWRIKVAWHVLGDTLTIKRADF